MDERALSVGDLGLFLILAYVVGHLIQAVGNLIENLWWRAWGGWPTDWVRSGKRELLSTSQIAALERDIETKLELKERREFKQLPASQWFGITRQVYAAVSSSGRAARVDTFNGNYGLCRGIAASFLVLFVLTLLIYGPAKWQVEAALLAASGVALYRMHRFARHYARELFVQFVDLPSEEASSPQAEPSNRGIGGTTT